MAKRVKAKLGPKPSIVGGRLGALKGPLDGSCARCGRSFALDQVGFLPGDGHVYCGGCVGASRRSAGRGSRTSPGKGGKT